MTFVGDVETAIAQSRAAAGDIYVNILGASVAAQCLEAGVLDEVLVSVMPVLLGDGTRLFEQPGGRTAQLELVSVPHTPQVTKPRHPIARASACTPVTICDSLRLAYPNINPGGAVAASA